MPHRGQIHAAWLAFLASIVLFAALVLLLVTNTGDRAASSLADQPPLMVYCAAALKLPVDDVAKQWEAENFGSAVRLQYGSSASLLANIEITQRGDLFIPADESDLLMAQQKGLVGEILPLATMRPVLLVANGNPLAIGSITDITSGKVRVAQGNESTAIGRLTQRAIEHSGHANAFRRVAKYHGTVISVGTAIETGAADAGFVWDANVGQFQNVEAINLEELRGYTANVAVGVLTSSKQPSKARLFARYLVAKDRGLPAFERAGFHIVPGKAWDQSSRHLPNQEAYRLAACANVPRNIHPTTAEAQPPQSSTSAR